MWVDAFHDGIKSPAQVEKLVADAHRANLNALIVQVRKAGDAYFNHSDEPRATDITGPPDFDPLAYVIRLAHASVPRIEVHAWLNTFFAGESSQVYLQHGDVWGNRADDGSTSGYLDPGVPEVQTYTHRGRATRGGRHGAERVLPVLSATSMTTSSVSIPTSSSAEP